MTKYLVTISYDGSGFSGWAKQIDRVTVQGYIETNLSYVLRQKIIIFASSRTDKGVHAREQSFTFDLIFPSNVEKIKCLLNKSLKKLYIKKVKIVTSSFHPIRSVADKEYRYYINTGKLNIWQRNYRWEYNLPIESSILNNILQTFVGRHDFFNFSHCRLKDYSTEYTTRNIESIKVTEKNKIIIISIKAPHFLRYQIRAIVAEAISCYQGKQNITDLLNKISVKKIDKYNSLAPPGGLYLWKIKYVF